MTFRTPPIRIAAGVAGALMALSAAPAAQASMFQGETLDAVADGAAWVVLALVPLIGIAVFWMVHVLPEKIAEKRHHPQKQAIHTLCLLSLVFGGLLWPIAWLWAYTRPVNYKAAYGTDKHEDYYVEMSERAARGDLEAEQLAHLREELAQMKARGQLTPQLMALYERLPSAAPPVLPPAAQGAG
jgi:CBS domain containing-hemolysin-like protein